MMDLYFSNSRIIVISDEIEEKLRKKHDVTRREIEQCFDNRTGRLLIDNRPENATKPPTRWFIAETNNNRLLKVVYVRRDGQYFLKTAYEPNSEELRIYRKYGV